MRGYVSQLRGYLPLIYKFKKELKNSQLYLDIEEEENKQLEELGMSNKLTFSDYEVENEYNDKW